MTTLEQFKVFCGEMDGISHQPKQVVDLSFHCKILLLSVVKSHYRRPTESARMLRVNSSMCYIDSNGPALAGTYYTNMFQLE